jgi:hypothetical protein
MWLIYNAINKNSALFFDKKMISILKQKNDCYKFGSMDRIMIYLQKNFRNISFSQTQT